MRCTGTTFSIQVHIELVSFRNRKAILLSRRSVGNDYTSVIYDDQVLYKTMWSLLTSNYFQLKRSRRWSIVMKDDILRAWMDTFLFRERSQTPSNSTQCCGSSIVRGIPYHEQWRISSSTSTSQWGNCLAMNPSWTVFVRQLVPANGSKKSSQCVFKDTNWCHSWLMIRA